MTTNDMERSKIVESSDTIEAIEECYRMGWSDGLLSFRLSITKSAKCWRCLA